MNALTVLIIGIFMRIEIFCKYFAIQNIEIQSSSFIKKHN